MLNGKISIESRDFGQGRELTQVRSLTVGLRNVEAQAVVSQTPVVTRLGILVDEYVFNAQSFEVGCQDYAPAKAGSVELMKGPETLSR